MAKHHVFSFRNKLLLIILFIGIIPIVVTGFLSNYKFNQLLEDQAEDITLQALRQSEGYLTMYFSEIEQIGIFASTHEVVLNILKQNKFESTYEMVVAANNVREALKQYISVRYDIERIDIIGFNGFSYAGGYTNIPVDENEPWLQEVLKRNGTPYWFAIEGGKYMVYSRVITSDKANEKLGIVRIIIPSYRLESVLNKFQPLGSGFLLLLDQNRQPIIGRSHDVEQVMKNEKNMFITQLRMEKPAWEFVSVMPKDEVLQGTRQIRLYFSNTVIIILLVTFTFAIWITYRFTKPIKQVITLMQDVERNNFTSRMEIKSKDEIGMLAISYNRMVQRVNSLINEVYQQQLLKNEAEWNALQAQINPHFLHNTLDSVNWIARMNRIPEIVKMITALSKLFKLSLSKADKFIAVEEELIYIKYYAQIQETRFSDRIRIMTDVPQTIRHYFIPRFILQPLVENSIVHGLEPKEGPGEVHVKGWEYGDKIFFIVQDNGVGIPADKLKTLLLPESKTNNHLGLKNVDERIKLLYGQEWGLKIDSIEGVGTIVEVWLSKNLPRGDGVQ
jgi:two-component system, sensor histidine kinase YesM